MLTSQTSASLDLLKAVRAGFVAQGTSLHAYCVAEGLKRQNVSAALSGKWRGPKAEALIQRAVAASAFKVAA